MITKPKLILILLSVLGLSLILGQSIFWSKSNKPNLAFAEAEEQTVVLQNGLNNYNGTQDAYIQGGSGAGSNFNKPSITVKNGIGSATYLYKGYIKFDISSIVNKSIKSAKLLLYRTKAPQIPDGIKISQVKGDWDEETLTWNNAPAFGEQILSKDIGTTVDTWIEFDVISPVIEAIHNNPPNLNIGLESTVGTLYNEGETVFNSSEQVDISLRPKLIITYTLGAPLANAGADQEVGKEALITLDGSKSSAPNESSKDLIYSWRILSSPFSSNLRDNDISPNNTTGINGADKPTLKLDAVGIYDIELTVTNSLGLSGRDTVRILSFYIQDKHPRIWLTPEFLNVLKQKVANNTPEWQRFKNFYVDGGKGGVQVYALMYQITGNTTYADKAIVKMNESLGRDMTKSYEGNLGIYYARSWPLDISIGFDWLYDYLTAEERTKYVQQLNEWRDVYTSDAAFSANSPTSDFFYGYIIGEGMSGLATYGDNQRAREFIDHARYKMYEKYARPFLENVGQGGDWGGGLNYGQHISNNLADYFEAVKTATGENLFEQSQFLKDVIYYTIYSTLPSQTHFVPLARWSREPEGLVYDSHRRYMLKLARAYRNLESAEYAQYWLNHVYQMVNEAYSDFIWGEPEAIERSFDSLPLDYKVGGTGLILTRSDWSKDATFLSFQAKAGFSLSDEGHGDANSFTIFRQEWIAPELGSYVEPTSGHNTILINNQGQTRASDASGTLKNFEASQDYVYAVGEASDAYNSKYYDILLLENFTRELVYLKPDFAIVFDRVTSIDPNASKKWLLHFWNKPDILGNLAAGTHGEAKLFSKTLFPQDVTINLVDEGNRNNWFNSWRVEVQPNVSKKDDLFLHVLYATDISTAEMPATVRVDAENMVGAQIADRLVMFSKTEQNQNQVTYNLPETQAFIQHLITDLEPRFTYNIYQDSSLIDNKTVTANGTIYFSSEGGGNFQITQGEPNNSPTVKITAKPTSGKSPLKVDFTAKAEDIDGAIVSYFWDFGDGENSIEQNPTHTYKTAGTYTAKVEVIDNLGAKGRDKIIIVSESEPALSIDDVRVIEGNVGTKNAVFTVTLSEASNKVVTVDYNTVDGTATAGSDYVARSGTLIFTAGMTTQTIIVVVNGDTIKELDETYFVNLNNAVNASISDNEGVGTITDDDDPNSIFTVVLQNGIEFEGEIYDGADDCSIRSGGPHYDEVLLENWWYYHRGLLRFDLSSIPPGEIRSAVLSLYIASYPGLHNDLKSQGKINLAIHKVTQPNWDYKKADWNKYDGTNNWTTPGGDFNPTPVSTFTIDTVEAFQDMWVNFDVTTLIQEYINQGTEPNPGMLLKASTQVYPILIFVNSKSADVSLRPRLEITLKTTPKPNITLSKTADVSTAKTGDIITYTITYKNTGEGEARNVVISDPIPDNTELVEILDNGVLEGNTVRWTIASLSAEQGGSVRMRVRVK